jgi:hypothetical protein
MVNRQHAAAVACNRLAESLPRGSVSKRRRTAVRVKKTRRRKDLGHFRNSKKRENTLDCAATQTAL